MKFLVVYDSLTMRRIIINALERIGYTDAIEASDGHEALNRFDASIGFVITDWNMPQMSGLDFARAVRATPSTCLARRAGPRSFQRQGASPRAHALFSMSISRYVSMHCQKPGCL